MLKIRRIYDDYLPVNREILSQVQQILRTRFSAVSEEEIATIGEKLRNPFKQRFRTILLVAENLRRRVLGFALLLHEPEIAFCYLDWIALASGSTGGGLGSALYDSVRREAVALQAKGLFFECLPDTPESCADHAMLKQNRARLRFYERYGARPIANTGYELPVIAACAIGGTSHQVSAHLGRDYLARCPRAHRPGGLGPRGATA